MNKLQTNGRTCSAATLDARSSSTLRDVARDALGNALAPILAAVAAFDVLYDRWDQRRQLRRLDDRLLRDIGLDRYDVEREIRKPFWVK